MTRGLNKWKVVLYLVAIFAAGAVSGWVLMAKTAKQTMFTAPRWDEIADSWRGRLHEQLNLTPEQGRQIDAIIDASSQDIHAIHGEWVQRIRQAISNRNVQVAAVLTPEQQEQFLQMEKERQEARGRRGRPDYRGKHGGRDRRRDGPPRDPDDSAPEQPSATP